MRSATIVVTDVFVEDRLQMPLVDGDEIVQALASDRADQAFAECVFFAGRRFLREGDSYSSILQLFAAIP